MPPRFYPGQANQTPRPLQNELVALQKLLNDVCIIFFSSCLYFILLIWGVQDILEQAAHILDHYTATMRKGFPLFHRGLLKWKCLLLFFHVKIVV